ncbi:hypothetical protein AJ80_01165 [Polytolypa hystricis UAMH7299]|uniref:histone acetyltransferase n=1 Tax=Polytolypa hystricis (strain UAMH7299) TaxID=1447883 RepID=A0A2B7Z254_POLH7|nr:hypothetical protein AJ80_01165 [Polytolypa hystricis UAMH7299]
MPASSRLGEALAQAAPKDVKLIVRHLATKPTPCAPIFSPAPGQSEEPTACANHFLTVSIAPKATRAGGKESADDVDDELFVFAVEVLVYTTAELTTVFVSKADSTGYTHLLNLPPKGKSLIRGVSTAFLSHIVRTQQRPGIRLVLSLFARAQNQYLFPGSIDNPNKHVLDDRALIKWWCRVADPILRRCEGETHGKTKNGLVEDNISDKADVEKETSSTSATAYLIVPGCDRFETRSFFPPSAKSDPQDRLRWLNSYPLKQLCAVPTAPPRCLIPRFPDDPKERFVSELDDEIPGITDSSSDSKNPGQWRSIKTLDQFWEMIAYRQECSSGRLVGFLWIVVNPPGMLNSAPIQRHDGQGAGSRISAIATPESSQNVGVDVSSIAPGLATILTAPLTQPSEATPGQAPDEIAKPLSPPLSRLSSFNEPTSNQEELSTTTQASATPATHDDSTIVLSEDAYQSILDHLLDLDFADVKLARESTKAWISKLADLVGSDRAKSRDEMLGDIIVGECEIVADSVTSSTPIVTTTTTTEATAGTSNMLSAGLVRKRKKPDVSMDENVVGDGGGLMTATSESVGGSTVSTSLAAQGTADQNNNATNGAASNVNILGAGLVRKKKKI